MSASVQSFCHVLFWLLMVTERPLMVRTVAAPVFLETSSESVGDWHCDCVGGWQEETLQPVKWETEGPDMISDDSPGLGLTGGKYQAGRARGCLAGDQWAHRHGDTSSPLVLDTLPAHTHRPLPPARIHSGSRHQHLSPPTRLLAADCSQKTERIILSVCR